MNIQRNTNTAMPGYTCDEIIKLSGKTSQNNEILPKATTIVSETDHDNIDQLLLYDT